ncbi:hypothetical protein TNCV_771521 [Trichonephila clavipes]|nr:hypothetical protein TNCV_771521 [Trichonephila clavipes]
MNQTCFLNVEEWSETNITGDNRFQWYFLTLSQVNWEDMENYVEFLSKEIPDTKINDNCLFEVERRLNAYGDETVSCGHAFEWYKKFSGAKISVDDDEHAVCARENLLKVNPFYLNEEVQAKTKNFLKGLPNPTFHNLYQRCQHRMKKCVNAEGNYFEGVTVTEN